jgi:MoaA/NifB/PqqE/SkfB family radical SAM enzyme
MGLMLRVLTFFRIWNYLLLKSSYYLTRVLKRRYVWAKPFAIGFEPTTHCNLRCPECPSGLRSFSRPTGFADVSLFTKTLDETKRHAFYLTLYFQGEPFLHPEIIPMIQKAKKRGFFVATSSNAHFFTPQVAEETVASGLDKLIISFDGLTQETYQKYRIGGDLEKVRSGVSNLIQAKKKQGKKNPIVGHSVFSI